MKIAFYANRMYLEGDFLTRIGTGGSESALLNMTQAWKKRYPEDEIVIFNYNRIRSKDYNGVIYKSIPQFNSEITSNQWDAFISLRDHQPFLHPFINAKIKCLWSQDDMNEIGLQTIRDNPYMRANVDLFFVISHHSWLDISLTFQEKECIILRNGYNADWANPSFDKKDNAAIYCSTPFRGLDVLAEVWKDIYYGSGNQPELRVFTGMGLYRQDDGPFKALYQKLNTLPGASVFDPASQRQLYTQMQRTKVLLYPNHFLETGSMAVLESLANGNWVITTDLGALGEQVKEGVNGNLIQGNAHSSEYKDKFVKAAINYFKHPLIPNSNGLIFSWDEQTYLMRKSIQERI